MNSQEALDYIETAELYYEGTYGEDEPCISHGLLADDDCYKESLDVLQELVEKATPRKPMRRLGRYYCPRCQKRKYIQEQQYCDECGQKIDWSKE